MDVGMSLITDRMYANYPNVVLSHALSELSIKSGY
jgi:hypothetical protein